MSVDPNKRPIIIKKVKKVSGGGHHGGAWKVAYADFVTAMMAFFLLLWLLAQAPKEKLKGLADYFTPTVGVQDKIGISLKGATGDIEEGIKTKAAAVPNVMPGAPVVGEISQQPKSDEQEDDKLQITKNAAEEIENQLETKRFQEIEKNLTKAIEDDPSLSAFKNNIQVKETQEGLQIEITDLDGISMFEIGSSNLRAETQPLIAKVSEAIQKVDNKISIIGHTDATGYKNTNGQYSNWELSADRANASRRFLVSKGLDEKRIFKVEGKADRDKLVKDKPESAQNRRISIILLKKSIAPVDPKPGEAPAETPPAAVPEKSAEAMPKHAPENQSASDALGRNLRQN